MKTRTKVLLGSALALAIVGSTVGVVVANGADDDDSTPDVELSGTALDQATAAALAHTGGGEVIETEEGDGGAAYGVEIRLDDGSVVEVNLDAAFQVTGEEADDDGAGED